MSEVKQVEPIFLYILGLCIAIGLIILVFAEIGSTQDTENNDVSKLNEFGIQTISSIFTNNAFLFVLITLFGLMLVYFIIKSIPSKIAFGGGNLK